MITNIRDFMQILNDIRKLKLMFKKQKYALKRAFFKIKSELEDHLDAINQNTLEIQSNYNYIFDLEQKIEKLNERLDLIYMYLAGEHKSKYSSNIKLTLNEQKVFAFLYILSKDMISFRELSYRTGVDNISIVINTMINKGIPLIIKHTKNSSYVMLDPNFKHIQIKHNVVNIDKNIMNLVYNS